MNIILLSGGSGKRLWPLSNDIRSKQFLKIFRDPCGNPESMLQRMYRQIKDTDKEAAITIATSKTQVSAIHNQLGHGIGLSVEPCRRDTFAAIILASAYLHDVEHVSEEEAVAVCPVDPYVDREYFTCIGELGKLAEAGTAKLMLMGIVPAYPSDKYGYIIPGDEQKISRVHTFKEKPDEETAKEYIAKGGLWNSGVFAYKLGYVLQKAEERAGCSGYYELLQRYDSLPRISFDYEVAEKEEDIQVLRYSGKWKDLGTWDTLSESMSDAITGYGIMDETCGNVNIINELDIPVLVMGIHNAVVSAGPDGILVADKIRTGCLKHYVHLIREEARFAEKSWGEYKVIHISEHSITVMITVKAGRHMSYHSHELRDEVWTIVSGNGRTVVDGVEQYVKRGDIIAIQAGCRHTVIADSSGLEMIEVQMGEGISVHDKKKFAFDMQAGWECR